MSIFENYIFQLKGSTTYDCKKKIHPTVFFYKFENESDKKLNFRKLSKFIFDLIIICLSNCTSSVWIRGKCSRGRTKLEIWAAMNENQ